MWWCTTWPNWWSGDRRPMPACREARRPISSTPGHHRAAIWPRPGTSPREALTPSPSPGMGRRGAREPAPRDAQVARGERSRCRSRCPHPGPLRAAPGPARRGPPWPPSRPAADSPSPSGTDPALRGTPTEPPRMAGLHVRSPASAGKAGPGAPRRRQSGRPRDPWPQHDRAVPLRPARRVGQGRRARATRPGSESPELLRGLRPRARLGPCTGNNEGEECFRCPTSWRSP
jgi:hypothetical protein